MRDFSKALALGYNRAAVEAQLVELRQEWERQQRADRAKRKRLEILARLWNALNRN